MVIRGGVLFVITRYKKGVLGKKHVSDGTSSHWKAHRGSTRPAGSHASFPAQSDDGCPMRSGVRPSLLIHCPGLRSGVFPHRERTVQVLLPCLWPEWEMATPRGLRVFRGLLGTEEPSIICWLFFSDCISDFGTKKAVPRKKRFLITLFLLVPIIFIYHPLSRGKYTRAGKH